LLGTLNIVRAGRPQDKTLAAITLLGTACWALVAFAFEKSIGNLLDPRPLSHVIISAVLVIFSLITLRRKPGLEPA
jgi:membrane protein DedA with SNARE-associated domain